MNKVLRTLLMMVFFTNTSFANDLIKYKTNYEVGEPVWFELKDAPQNNNDWIGIYPSGTATDWGNVVAWRWIGENSHAEVDPGTWYKFPDNNLNNKQEEASLPAGRYVARLFLNNSYNVEHSVGFTVGEAQSMASIKAHKQTYSVNENVWLELKNAPGNLKNWVGIYPAGTNTDWENVVTWRWASEKSQTQVDPGVWYKFPDNNLANKGNEVALPVGNYVARFFLNNSYKVENGSFFRVTGEDKLYPPDTRLTPLNEVDVNRPPQIFSSYIDSAFDNQVKRTVTRVTNREKDKKGANAHQYPKHGSAWNSDMTLLRIGQRIYDAETLEEIKLTKGLEGSEVDQLMQRPESGASGLRWSKKNPSELYVMSGDNHFYKLTLSNDRSTITKNLIYDLNRTGIANFTLGHNEGNIDYNDKYVLLSATVVISKDKEEVYAVLLDLQNKSLVWGKPKKLPYSKGDDFDWISVSPSGHYIVASANNQIDLYRANSFTVIKEAMAKSAEHGDIGYDNKGDEIYLQLETNGNENHNSGIYGYVLKNQTRIELLGSNYGGGHISCRNYQLKGWCYVGTNQQHYREVFSLKLDGSQTVRRFAQTHARGDEDRLGDDDHYYYASHPTANVSPDGTRVLFWSDFGNPEKSLYYERLYDNDGGPYWDTKPAYYNRDTYQVIISK